MEGVAPCLVSGEPVLASAVPVDIESASSEETGKHGPGVPGSGNGARGIVVGAAETEMVDMPMAQAVEMTPVGRGELASAEDGQGRAGHQLPRRAEDLPLPEVRGVLFPGFCCR